MSDDEEFDEEEFDEEEEDLEEEYEEEEEEAAVEEAPVAAAEAPSEEILSADKIPFSVVVEAGRVQLSMQQLMELKPGNLLEMNLQPESGVDLVINGKKVGRGELVRIGDTLGVRVLEKG